MRVIFGCESARKGSYQAIRTFPRGYASYSQTEVNTLLSRQKSSYSIRSGPRVIHNEHCFQSATDFLIYTQIAILFSMHTGRTHEDYFTVFGANSARIASKIRVSSALSAGRIRLSNSLRIVLSHTPNNSARFLVVSNRFWHRCSKIARLRSDGPIQITSSPCLLAWSIKKDPATLLPGL